MSPRRKKKARTKQHGKAKVVAARPPELPRTGMPALDSIREIIPFTSPSKRAYRIIKTDERDAYE